MTATAVGLDELAAMRTEEKCPLVRGQYSIVPDGEKKAVLHQRVSNFKRPLADMFNIDRWDRHNIVEGIVRSPGLQALAASTPRDDKDAWDDICEQARAAVKAGDKASGGTGRHTMTERIDRGESLDTFPEPYRSELAAYQATLEAAGMEIVEIEQYVVLPEWRVAGRFDRLVSFGSKPMIADLKTGSIDFGMGEIAVQLACYANAATIYDPQTCRHRPMPDVDKETGLVIHLPAGKAECTLHFVDIAAGWEAAQHAQWVKQWRKRKDLSDPWRPGIRFDALIERRTNLVARIEMLKAHSQAAIAELASSWPNGIPTFKQSTDHTPEQLNAIDTVLSTIEDKHHAPFGNVDPNQRKVTK
jgi:hypothetical protein